MQQRAKLITKALPPLRTIQATDNEIIILQAALRHYQFLVSENKELAGAAPLIQNFIGRLHDTLLQGKE